MEHLIEFCVKHIYSKSYMTFQFTPWHLNLGGIERSNQGHWAVYNRRCIIRQRSYQTKRPLIFKNMMATMWLNWRIPFVYVSFDVTWRKNGTSYITGATNTSDRYSTRNISLNQPEVSTTSGSKVIAQTVVFVIFVTLSLTFDLCSICFVHALGMKYWNLIRIGQVLIGDMPWTHTPQTHTEGKINSLANPFGTRLTKVFLKNIMSKWEW